MLSCETNEQSKSMFDCFALLRPLFTHLVRSGKNFGRKLDTDRCLCSLAKPISVEQQLETAVDSNGNSLIRTLRLVVGISSNRFSSLISITLIVLISFIFFRREAPDFSVTRCFRELKKFQVYLPMISLSA